MSDIDLEEVVVVRDAVSQPTQHLDELHPRSEHQLRHDVVVAGWRTASRVARWSFRHLLSGSVASVHELPPEQRVQRVDSDAGRGPLRNASTLDAPGGQFDVDRVPHSYLDEGDLSVQCAGQLRGPKVQIDGTAPVAVRGVDVGCEPRGADETLEGVRLTELR
ncbi:hypothetical protein ACVKXF_000985 [Curtobacterium sp. PvP017]